MIVTRSPEVEAFWQACRAANGIEATDYHACTFADPTYTDKLDYITEHCRAGHKRGTAHLAIDFELSGVPRREVDDYFVVLGDAGRPICVVRIVKVEIKPFEEVGPDFAARENEGDASLEYWANGHRGYFQKQCAAWGREWSPRLDVVCEYFELVYTGVR